MSKEANKILNKHSNVNNRVGFGQFGKMVRMSDAIKAIDEALQQVENNDSPHSVSHCPNCGSESIHQYKLHHIHCKDCKGNYNKSCD